MTLFSYHVKKGLLLVGRRETSWSKIWCDMNQQVLKQVLSLYLANRFKKILLL